MDDFIEKWCYKDAICSVVGDDLIIYIICTEVVVV